MITRFTGGRSVIHNSKQAVSFYWCAVNFINKFVTNSNAEFQFVKGKGDIFNSTKYFNSNFKT